MLKRHSWVWLAVVLVFASQQYASAKGRHLWQFRVLQDDIVSGRFDFGVVHREGVVYAVSAFYQGEKALETGKRNKLQPVRRSYAELTEPGILGKYKRWDIRDKVERYWMTFTIKDKVKVRYEKGPGARGEVTEIGSGEAVVPLDGGQPQFAYLLAARGESGKEVDCVGVVPGSWGKATVVFSGPEELPLPGPDAEKVKTDRWDVMGDCGSFKVYLDESRKPLLITSGNERYVRITGEKGVKKGVGKGDKKAPAPSGG